MMSFIPLTFADIFRLDPTNGTKVGTGIGERDGGIRVTQILDDSAGQKAGLRLNDRLISIDGTVVDTRDACKMLVQRSNGNPFDMLIERPLESPETPAPILPATTAVSF